MIRLICFSVIGMAALAGALLIGRNTSPGQGAKATEGQPKNYGETGMPFAVVELFTSEGCSSCPPADDLLGEIVKDAEKRQQRVFGLSFHVDYWNSLGWRDPYSDAAFSRRQREYARALKSDQVYTPQMVVNGRTEFVGSDRTRARKQIDLALKQPAPAAVKLTQEEKKDMSSVAFAYEVERAARGSVLNVAVVERGLVSKVKRGENGGRTLRHENVVRAQETSLLGDAAKGTVQLKLPADLVRKNSMAIAYVQDSDTWAILGATAVEIQPAAPRSR
jgi:hypothetical protein